MYPSELFDYALKEKLRLHKREKFFSTGETQADAHTGKNKMKFFQGSFFSKVEIVKIA